MNLWRKEHEDDGNGILSSVPESNCLIPWICLFSVVYLRRQYPRPNSLANYGMIIEYWSGRKRPWTNLICHPVIYPGGPRKTAESVSLHIEFTGRRFEANTGYVRQENAITLTLLDTLLQRCISGRSPIVKKADCVELHLISWSRYAGSRHAEVRVTDSRLH